MMKTIIRNVLYLLPMMSLLPGFVETASEKQVPKRKDAERFHFSPVQQRKLGTRRRKVDGDTPKPASLPMCGLPNYLPDRPSGEDETFIGKHKEWLQDEKRARRKRPDMSQIDKRMTLTFADCRLMVVERNTAVSEVIEEYPWLETFHQVCK